MFDLDKWEEILDTIRRHKLRTFLTAFGVYWGILMLVILMGAVKGLQNGIEFAFRDDATNSIWVWPGTSSMPHGGLPLGRKTVFTNTDYERTKEDIQGVDHITARFFVTGEFVIAYKNKSASFSVRSVHPDHQILENTQIREGRYINEIDLAQKRKVCVIGKLVKEALFGEENPLGKFIRIKGVDFQVVGWYTDTGGKNEMMVVYLPIATAQLAFNGQQRINQFMFTTGSASVEDAKKIEEQLIRELASRHKFDPTDKEAIYVNNNVEEFEKFQNLFLGMRMVMWFVSIGSLVAGIVGVSNIMLITVKERTREIGIRKAMGATPWSVVSMIMQESVTLTGIAGYFGMLVGVGLLQLVDSALKGAGAYEGDRPGFFRTPEIDFGVAISAIIILTLAGALAGLFPALKAARVSPVEAMRAE
jgi:putative ABC transport system permease protein